MGPAQFIRTNSSTDKTSSGLLDGTGKQMLNLVAVLGELVIGCVCTGQVHFHVFGKIRLIFFGCVAPPLLESPLVPKRVCANETNSDMRS